jgi:hypothetical protein
MTRRGLGLTVAAALLAGAAGCGTAAAPGEVVPALRTQLSRVDAALADHKYADARNALDALTRETAAARNAGRLTAEQTDRIVAAAARLAADLPPPSPTPQPTVTLEVPERRGDKGTEKQQGDNQDDGKEDEQNKGKGGDGRNSGNRPDDGDGN